MLLVASAFAISLGALVIALSLLPGLTDLPPSGNVKKVEYCQPIQRGAG